MLYKLRNNASVSFDQKNNMSVFGYIRTAIMPNVAYGEALTHKAQELSTIVEKITGGKQDGSFSTIPIEDTLKILEDYGFIISGNTEEELEKKEIALYRNF
jgi:hypothetical protein